MTGHPACGGHKNDASFVGQQGQNMSVFRYRSVQRPTALMVAMYFGLSQLAILPAAFESASNTPVSDAQSPYSLSSLVSFLDRTAPQLLTAADAPSDAPVVDAPLSQGQLDAALAGAIADWQDVGVTDDLSGVTITTADLAGLDLGQSAGEAITVDLDAAGHGWDVVSSEPSRMDLGTVVRHELGHVLGLDHESTGLMSVTLATDTSRAAVAPEPATTEPATTEPATTEPATTEPATTEPATTEPATTEPATTEPAATEPAATEPASAWVIDGTVATLTADGPLGSTLTWDATSVTLTDAAGVAETLDVTGLDSVVILGSAAADTITLGSGSAAPVAVTVDLAGGTDTLVGPSTDQVWLVTGGNAGSVVGVTFASAEQLVGAADNEDTFEVAAGGAISGVIEGGSGGFDTITVDGAGSALLHSVITGLDSGTITRDSDVVTYAGMEPVGLVGGTDPAVTGTSLTDDFLIEDNGNATDGIIWVRVSTGEDHEVDLNGAATLTIDGAGGIDTFTFGTLDDILAGLAISLIGGADADSIDISALDIAGTWSLTGLGVGAWSAADGSASFTYDGFEDITGAATAAESYEIEEGGTVAGTITDGTGELTIGLKQFGRITGDFSFGSTTYDGTVSGGGGTFTGANVVTVSGTDGDVFFGLRSGLLTAGVEGDAGDWGIALITDGTDVWHVWTGTFSNPTLTPIGGPLELDASSFAIGINSPSASRAAIDFSGNNLVVGSTSIAFAGESASVSAAGVRLEIAEFVWAEGTLTLEIGEDRTVEIGTADLEPGTVTALQTEVDTVAAAQLADGATAGTEVAFDGATLTNVPVTTLTMSLQDATVFVGRNPLGFSLFDGVVGDFESLGADGFVILGLDLGFAMAMVRPEELSALLPSFVGVKATFDDLHMVGLVDGLDIGVLTAVIAYNHASEVAGQAASSAWVRWASSFPGSSGLEVNVPGSTEPPLLIDMDTPVLAVSADDALLTLDGYLSLAGGFAFERGDTLDVSVVTTNAPSTGTATVTVDTTYLGFSSADIFVGDPGDFTATIAGWDCSTVESSTTAVGMCVSGITLGMIFARDTAADSLLPDFFAMKGTIAEIQPIGLPDFLELGLREVSFVANIGGEVLDGPGGAAVTGSSAHVDWLATPATVATGTTPAGILIDLDQPIFGVAATEAILDIGGFVSIAGSFSFVRGATETVELGIAGLDGAQTTSLTSAADAVAGVEFAGGVLSGIQVTTSLIGIGNAAVFAGYAPDADGFSFGTPFDCDSYADGVGVCVDGIQAGLALASLLTPGLLAGWTLPDFFAARVDLAGIDLLGLPTEIFNLEIDGVHLEVNRGGTLTEGTTEVVGSSAWVRWKTSFSDVGLAVPTGSGEQLLSLDDPLLRVAADRVLLTINNFLAIRGSFSVEQGGLETVTVETAGLGTQEGDLAAAVTAAPDLTWDNGTISGLAVVTTLIGFGNAAVFAGYNPDGFTAGFDGGDDFVCDDLTSAYGFCADGIEVGVALASLTDPAVIAGFALPNFTGARVTIADPDILGLPTEYFDLDFDGVEFVLNRGGAISTVVGTTRTAIEGSNSWIDWAASFEEGADPVADPAGLPVPTGSGTIYIDMSAPIIGVSADRAYLRIGDFVSVSGSFAFENGGIIDLAVDTPTLDSGQRTTLASAITNTTVAGDGILIEDVFTSTFGIGNADVYVGYADGGFDATGAPVGDFYGLQTTGINVGMIWATVDTSRITGPYTLPTFFGLTAEIEEIAFAGIPADVLSFTVTDAELAFNSSGTVGGFTGTTVHTAHASWKTSTDLAGTADGVAVNVGNDESVIVSHEDAVIGLRANQVVLTVGSFIHISGSFAFETGADELLDVRVLGLQSAADLTSLTNAVAAATAGSATVTGAINDGDVTINDVLMRTTLFGIADATVFAGYHPGGFVAGEAIDCTDAELQDQAFGFCLDNIAFGMVLASAVAGTTGTYVLPDFMALRANLPSFDIHTNLLGLGDLLSEFELYFENLAVTVNRGGDLVVGASTAKVFVDWVASFDGDPDGPFSLATGAEDELATADVDESAVIIDFDSPILSIGADVVVLSLSDFVHVSGGFQFTMGDLMVADVDVFPTVGSAQQVNDVLFQTTTFGISNAALFVGYNPNATGTSGSSFDIGPDKVFDRDDLDADAVGVLLSDLDFGMVFATAEANLQGWKLPNFTGLRAANAEFELFNLLPDFIEFRIEDLGATFTKGGTASKLAISGRASIDWSSVDESAQGASDGHYDIPTGPTAAPLELDVRGDVIGVEAGLVVFTISEFIHISGGFSITKGEVLNVDIDVNDSLASGNIVTSTIAVGDTDDVNIRRSVDGKRLFNVLVETLQIGVSDASIFVGYANLGEDNLIDLGEDDILTQDDVPNAFGILISDVDFAMVASTIIDGQLPAALKSTIGSPTFTTIKAFGEQLVLLGLEDLLTFEANGIAIELNFGKAWQTNGSGDIAPAIDWTSAFGSTGYEVSTGEGNDPLFLNMDGYLIGGGAELVVVSILDFIHVRGSFYFEKGVTVEVPLQSLLDVSFLPDEIEAFATGPKTLRFFNIGIADTYAFVGVGGPHWITVDAADATTDLRFECDPLAPDFGSCDAAIHCPQDADTTDGIARAIDAARCRTLVRGSEGDTFTGDDTPLGIALSDLDFALAIGTPVPLLPGVTDPTKYITLRASVEYAGLIGFEEYGLTAKLVGVALELNIATPTVSGFPILPAIDWAQYALDNGCTAQEVADGDGSSATCGAFGVKTGQRDAADLDGDGDTTELLTEDFFYDGLYIRAAVRHFAADIFGVVAVNGSIAFNLGPTETVTLANGDIVPGVLTMTLGGSDIFAFVGIDGPFWTQDVEGRIQYECDPDGDDFASCDEVTDCSYAAPQNPGDSDDCRFIEDADAIGLRLEDLDFGLFVGLKIPAADDPSQPGDETAAGVYIAANLTVGGIGLVGVPGIDANLAIAISLNLGFTLGGAGVSASAINFKDSFTYDEAPGDPDFDGDGITGELGQGGYLLDTGNSNAPMVIAYEDTFISVQMVGYINIVDVARIDGIFYLGIDLDAGAEEFRLLALGQMRIGSDVSNDTTTEPIVSIGALGVLILNSAGVAGDFTVELDLNVPLLEVEVGARVLFNSGATDQVLELPDMLFEYLEEIRDEEFGGDTGGLDDPVGLVSELIDRLEPCADDTDGDPLTDRCYVISGQAPELITGAGATLNFNADTVAALLGDDTKTVTYLGDGPYIAVVVSGRINIAGFAEFQGLGVIAVSGDAFQFGLAVTFQIGSNPAVSLNVGAKAVAIFDNAGFAIKADVVIQANLLSVFDLNVAGSLVIDTRPGNEVFQLALVGSVSVLGVISLDGTVLIVVGGELGPNAFYAGIDLSADLGPLELHALGFISSWGSFQLGFTGDVDLTFAGTGIQGGISANVSYCHRLGEPNPGNTTCQDNLVSYVTVIPPVNPTDPFGVVVNIPAGVLEAIQSYQTDSGPLCSGTEEDNGPTDPCALARSFARSFLAEIGGYVRVKLFGITLAGVRLSVSVGGYLGDTVSVKARFTVETFFGDFSKTVTIATFRVPSALVNSDVPPPNLADIESGVLVLNVGTRAHLREVCQDEIHEDYLIFRKGTKIYVQACGYSEFHESADFTSISGDFGDGDDILLIYPGVGKTVTAWGGTGNDDLTTADTASVTFYGGDGNDILMGSTVADHLDGGLGNDYIDGGDGLDVIIGGPGSGPGTDDDVFFGYGQHLAGETVQAGFGYDRMEIVGFDAPETVNLSTEGDDLKLLYGQPTPFTLTGIDELQLGLSGGDDLTVDGSVESHLDVLTIFSAGFRHEVLVTQEMIDGGLKKEDGTAYSVGDVLVTELVSNDTVTINLLGTADTVNITASTTPHPASFSLGDAAVRVVPGAVYASVPTLAIDWLDRILFTIANTGLASNNHDTVTVNLLGGTDLVAVASLKA
ncbi:MAG: cell division septation protein DedD, partial [Nonlabens sp.]